jgi:hypothetical protein
LRKTFKERFDAWSKRRDEQLRLIIVKICIEIERKLVRASRGNPTLTAEVLDARAIRQEIFGS